MNLFDFLFPEPIKKPPSKAYLDDKGYYRFKDSNILVHRWAAEKKLGRRLLPGEVVHHINRNKRDNSPVNLQVFASQKEHEEQHTIDALNHGWTYSMTGKQKTWTLYYFFVGMWK